MEDILKQRKLKGISWDELAKELPISGNSLRMAFNRKSVSDSYLEKICEKLEIQNAQNTLVNTNGNKFTELSDGTYDVEVRELPFKAYASYEETMERGIAYKDFNTAIFNVDRIGKGNYMAFTVKGDSMNNGRINDTPDGAKVLGRELQRPHWRDGFHETKYGWIILCKQNIFHKDIIGFDPEKGIVTCHSRNPSPEYSDFELKLDDCYQIFKVIKRIF